MSTAGDNTVKSLLDIMPDFSAGPLTEYRSCSSFDWRKMKLLLDGGEDVVRFKHFVYSCLERDPVFSKSNTTPSLDEQRHITTKRLKALKQLNIVTPDLVENNPKIAGAFTEAIFSYDINTPGKIMVMQMFINAVQNLGSDRHRDLLKLAKENVIQGCFAMTEVAHGSNVKGIKTTATYLPETKEFMIHTSDFQAAKCWMGHLGKSATHAIVFAKLIMPDGQNKGLHAFVVPLRDPKDMKTFPRVLIGDLGEKLGLNGIDNGFLMFNKYRIPKEYLLNKYGDVNDDGVYHSTINNESKRLASLLGAVGKGRVFLLVVASSQLIKAITVAVRYSAVRKQFSADDSEEELPIIEYQLQQLRVLPYLAAGVVTRVFANWLVRTHGDFQETRAENSESENLSLLMQEMEFHAITSATKPMITWIARDGIQISREACGGHGYLKMAGIGDIRNDSDANCTYEGENNVLLQQTANWLLYLWKQVQTGHRIKTSLGTADFINDYSNILKSKPRESDIDSPEAILETYKWLVCYTLSITGRKILDLLKSGSGIFSAKNNSQAYHAATLSIIYAEHTILNVFHEFAKKSEDENIRNVLIKTMCLLGAWLLEKHMGTLYIGKYFSNRMGYLLREFVVKVCSELKLEAVSLVDVLAPPDFALNSVLGTSDGNVYQNLETELFSTPGAFERPVWWKDISLVDNLQSKL